MEFGRVIIAESGILNFVSERFYKSRKTIFHVRKFFKEQNICLPHTFVLLFGHVCGSCCNVQFKPHTTFKVGFFVAKKELMAGHCC